MRAPSPLNGSLLMLRMSVEMGFQAEVLLLFQPLDQLLQ
jgi:hypothetical protein